MARPVEGRAGAGSGGVSGGSGNGGRVLTAARFSALVDRIGGSVSGWEIHYEAAAALQRGADVILLSIGDPDFATPPPVVEAAVAALRAGDTHYVEPAGRLELREAIAREHGRVSGQMVGPEQVIYLSGAQNALASAALCLCQSGDEVIVPEPMYLTYEASIRLSGAAIVPVPQPKGGGFRLDPAALDRAVSPRTRAIFFATPNNPTGMVATRPELEAMARLAIEYDLWVVADEVYSTLTYDRPHLSIAALPGMAERTVTLGSLSKSHAMTGWRAGWAVAPVEVIGHLTHLAMCMLYGLPGFVQAGALAALESGAEAQDEMRCIYRRRRDVMLDRLGAVPGLHCHRPEAGMFMLIDVTGTGQGADAFARGLYAATGVAVLDAEPFGPSAAGCVRVSFTNGEAQLAEACTRIARYAGSLA